MFSTTGGEGCTIKIPVPDTLAVGRCGCVGYVAATGPLAQAAFVNEDVPFVDTVMPTLRIARLPEADLGKGAE